MPAHRAGEAIHGVNVNHPVLLVIGAAILGFLVPEFFIALSKRNISAPLSQNVVCSIAFAIIAAAFAF